MAPFEKVTHWRSDLLLRLTPQGGVWASKVLGHTLECALGMDFFLKQWEAGRKHSGLQQQQLICGWLATWRRSAIPANSRRRWTLFPFLFLVFCFPDQPGLLFLSEYPKGKRELGFVRFLFLCIAGNRTQGLTHVWWIATRNTVFHTWAVFVSCCIWQWLPWKTFSSRVWHESTFPLTISHPFCAKAGFVHTVGSQ